MSRKADVGNSFLVEASYKAELSIIIIEERKENMLVSLKNIPTGEITEPWYEGIN